MNFKENINFKFLPQHIAIIMDGNGRWAKQRNEERAFGHQNGIKAVREVIEGAGEIGIKFITLYAFSTENWNRPKDEVDAIMSLLVNVIHAEVDSLNKNNVRLKAIGNLKSLPIDCQNVLASALEKTAQNKGLTLVLALNYSAKWEIIEAVKNISQKTLNNQLDVNQIDDELFENHLSTSFMPNPDLLIRTSGEQRLSNFLLWQLAYTELYFTPTLWPDFTKESLYEAIVSFQQKERRYGKTSEQLKY
ncbi:MAG: isoprenyl transferase [Bacteroidota bacterium]